MKKSIFSFLFLASTFVLILTATSSVQADTVTAYSNTSTTSGYSVPGTAGAGFDSSLTSQLTSGANQQSFFNTLSFTPTLSNVSDTFTSIPTGAPSSIQSNIQVVNLPGSSYWSGYSGFFMDTFTLPTNFTDASLSGAGNVDDNGYVYLNGNLLNTNLSEFSNTGFSASNQADFVAGTNQLVIADNNTGGGPSGGAYYANITYQTTGQSTVPEPCTMLLFSSGLLGIAGFRRNIFNK